MRYNIKLLNGRKLIFNMHSIIQWEVKHQDWFLWPYTTMVIISKGHTS